MNSEQSTKQQFPYYAKLADAEKPVELMHAEDYLQDDLKDPKKYISDPGLIDAADVALLLNQPLLLTGEAGSGKTQFAHHIADRLGWGEVLEFETKSTSSASDLFYSYDVLGRFHEAQIGGKKKKAAYYLNYQALGQAILYAKDPDDIPTELLPASVRTKGLEAIGHSGESRRSVVLIDEIDKASRDFPNDILREIEDMFFRVPFLLEERITADKRMRPFVIFTSNSEKPLPEPFLRRCVYYDVPFPDDAKLREIIASRLPELAKKEQFIVQATEIFDKMREAGLSKKPATAELLGWLQALQAFVAVDDQQQVNLREYTELIEKTLSTLAKTRDDLEKARDVLRHWGQ